jgi:hypothetical protein
MIINHGGAMLDQVALNYIFPFLQQGWVVALSAYRGEKICESDAATNTKCVGPLGGLSQTYTSDGAIELCLGKVIDVLQLTTMLSTHPFVNPAKMLMWGHSHGGCITVRAVAAGAGVAAAAAFDGPTNFAAWSNYCDPCLYAETQNAIGTNVCNHFWGNVAYDNAVTLGQPDFPDGGVPDAAAPDAGTFNCEYPVPLVDGGPYPCLLEPNIVTDSPYYCVYPGAPGTPQGLSSQGLPVSRTPYDWRSPVTYASDLATRNVKMLLIQGGADALVEPSQACELVAAVGSFTNVHVNTNLLSMMNPLGAIVTAVPPAGADPDAPTGCVPYALQWEQQGFSPLNAWPARSLVVFDTAGHTDVVDPTQLAYNVFLNWVNTALQ